MKGGQMEEEMYPSDETDLTSEQMDHLMADGEPVELAESPYQIPLFSGTNGVFIKAQTWGFGTEHQRRPPYEVTVVKQPA